MPAAHQAIGPRQVRIPSLRSDLMIAHMVSRPQPLLCYPPCARPDRLYKTAFACTEREASLTQLVEQRQQTRNVTFSQTPRALSAPTPKQQPCDHFQGDLASPAWIILNGISFKTGFRLPKSGFSVLLNDSRIKTALSPSLISCLSAFASPHGVRDQRCGSAMVLLGLRGCTHGSERKAPCQSVQGDNLQKQLLGSKVSTRSNLPLSATKLHSRQSVRQEML